MSNRQSYLELLASTLARSELFRSALAVPGDIVECGVHTGDGVILWAALIELFAPNSSKRVVAFDTFVGFPVAGSDMVENMRANQANSANDGLALSLEQVSRRLAEHGLESRVDLIPGDATFTIPSFVGERRGFRVSVLNLDFDLYEPSQVALETFMPRMVPGGCLLLDNFGTRKWGETDAADEYFHTKGLRYESIPWTKNPRAFARVPVNGRDS